MSHSPSPEGPGCCVLLVETSDESREVLRTVLARRGLQTIAADNAQQGLLLVEQHRPGVIVLDLHSDNEDAQSVCDRYAASSQARGASLVVLGAIAGRRQSAGERLVSKPYHFGPLIRTIEQLARRAMPAARSEPSRPPTR